jgi:hypothetical protein
LNGKDTESQDVPFNGSSVVYFSSGGGSLAVSLEWIRPDFAIARGGPEHSQFGDPFTHSVVIDVRDRIGVLKGLNGPVTPSEWREMHALLKEKNVTRTLKVPMDYDRMMSQARIRFSEGRDKVLSPKIPPHALKAFLQKFCAYGVEMTEQVPDWITRAGEGCLSRGYQGLGEALIAHARHEEGHEVYMAADARLLGAEALIGINTPGVKAYIQLHEEVIALHPHAQIAVEYEIERLSVDYGALLMKNVRCVLGDLDLSFIKTHTELDVAHAEFNHRQLVSFLSEHPDKLDDLVAAGEAALRAYGLYLDDCI